MSYGVVASKSASVMIEPLLGAPSPDCPATSHSDLALARFATAWGETWVPGRLTVTRLHLNFTPSRPGRATSMVDLRLCDVQDVEITRGRVSKVMTLRTGAHVVRVRAVGAQGLATEISELTHVAKRTPMRRLRDRRASWL